MSREKDTVEKMDDEGLAGLSADILRGRQSVRATFRLPVQMIALLSLAATQLGLKQKSLFNQLVEDREVLEQVAQMANHHQPRGELRRQKTYVVSRNALLSLEHVAKTCGLPRDLLVELSIQRLVPVLNSEQEKQRKRVIFLGEFETLYQQGLAVLGDAEQQLGEADPTTRLMIGMMAHWQRTLSELRQLVAHNHDLAHYQEEVL